ncbi:hypothetical protein ACR3AO_003420 [Bacillus wiedmannii]
MLKKLKKVMFVAIAAITLSTGFATIAPKEASAHWADQEIGLIRKLIGLSEKELCEMITEIVLHFDKMFG